MLAAGVAVPVRLECTLALVMPNGQFTNSAPVSISFTADGKVIRDAHIVDAGGILYPGGNMQLTRTPEAATLGAVPMPAERPGSWTGKIDKKSYRLELSNGPGETVSIVIGRTPVGNTGRLGLTWTASHQPAGLPRPLSGQGVGQCPQPAAVSGA